MEEPLSGTDRIANALEELVALVRAEQEPIGMRVEDTMQARHERVVEHLREVGASVLAHDPEIIDGLIDAVLG